MKHSELIKRLDSQLTKKERSKIIKINKGNSSGMNYLSLYFNNDKEKKSIKTKLNLNLLCDDVEKRYGIGFMIMDRG